MAKPLRTLKMATIIIKIMFQRVHSLMSPPLKRIGTWRSTVQSLPLSKSSLSGALTTSGLSFRCRCISNSRLNPVRSKQDHFIGTEKKFTIMKWSSLRKMSSEALSEIFKKQEGWVLKGTMTICQKSIHPMTMRLFHPVNILVVS
jgi:hypothetical protein